MTPSGMERSTRRVDRRSESTKTLNLIVQLTRRQISSEFKGTALGRLWSFINPLATIAVYAVIFGLVFRGTVEPGRNSGIDSFALWIGVGVLSWDFLSSGITRGMDALTGNSGLLTKVYFPRYVLVVTEILSLTYDFFFELVVLVAITGFVGGAKVLVMIPALIVITLLTGIFSLGLGLALSVATVYFRDISHLWSVFNQVWMYASGVVFPLSMLQSVQDRLTADGWIISGHALPLVTLFRLNPAEAYLEAFRALLYDFTGPPTSVWLLCIGWASISIICGAIVFSRHSARIVEEL
jgi:ABC-2 type transport system permease protein